MTPDDANAKIPPRILGLLASSQQEQEKELPTIESSDTELSLTTEKVPCACLNGGTCPETPGECVCKEGTKGRFCEDISVAIPEMAEVATLCKRKCQNGGICIPSKNRCRCPVGFRGRFCHKRKFHEHPKR